MALGWREVYVKDYRPLNRNIEPLTPRFAVTSPHGRGDHKGLQITPSRSLLAAKATPPPR